MQQQQYQQPNQHNIAAQAALAEGSRANANQRLAGADSTYLREWNRYKRWVTGKRATEVLRPGEKYITRDAIDLYFTEVVAHLTVTPKTAQRIRPSLQFFADKLEHVGEDFCVNSQFVNEGIATQTQTYINASFSNKSDPHKNLPCNILTHEEHVRALDYIFSNNVESWQSLYMSWTLGNNTLIRCDTFLKLCLPNLCFNGTHGPLLDENNTPLPMLSIILNAEQVKEGKKRKNKRITGSWRHKYYLRDATAAIAFSLFSKLYYDNSVNFYEGRGGENTKPSWWKIKLSFNQWKNTRVASSAYNVLLDSCGITWGKIVHMRAAGIEHASAMGELDAAAVATLSKHQKSNLDKVYMTELFPPILRVMAGFSYTENKCKTNSTIYHVPRCLIKLPWSDDQVSRFIFPKIDIWRDQYFSPEGDKSEAAKNFLFGVLPFLAQVVVQDGIYWIRDYPDHEISKLLLHVMPPNYERWSFEMRQKIINDERCNNDVLASSLNEGAKAALLSVKQAVQHEIHELHSKVQLLDEKLNRIESQLVMLNSTRPPPQSSPNKTTTPAAPTNPPTQQQPAAQVPADHSTRRLLSDVLRNTPKIPVFPPSLPKSMVDMHHQYESHDLSKWETTKMTGWPSSVKQAFCRRKYVNTRMKGRAMALHFGSFQQRLLRAAENMDVERHSKGMSVFSYINFLKENDPTVKSRKRKNMA